MSLLKRIESARPGAEGSPAPAAPPPSSGGGSQAPSAPPTARLMTQAPVRESFRDVKFRIQNRVIQDLDPKLDLSNQVEVRRQIEEIFGRVIDEEGLALTRAERVRMLEQITDEIIGLGPLAPGCQTRSPPNSRPGARSSRSCATRASRKSWSTARARSTSSAAAA